MSIACEFPTNFGARISAQIPRRSFRVSLNWISSSENAPIWKLSVTSVTGGRWQLQILAQSNRFCGISLWRCRIFFDHFGPLVLLKSDSVLHLHRTRLKTDISCTSRLVFTKNWFTSHRQGSSTTSRHILTLRPKARPKRRPLLG